MKRSTKILPRITVAALLVFTAASAQAKTRLTAAQRDVLVPVNGLFDAMAKHDVEASRKLIVPGAGFVVVKPDGTLTMEHDSDYLDVLGKRKESFRERIWNVQVVVSGNIAQVWAPYDFHLDGKLSHCGIDSFSMVRTMAGWRIAGISYSMQKEGCAPSPLDAKK